MTWLAVHRGNGCYCSFVGSAFASADVRSPATPTNSAPSSGTTIASHSPSVSKLCQENSTKVPPQSRPSGSTAYLLQIGGRDSATVDNEPRNAERRSEQLNQALAISVPMLRFAQGAQRCHTHARRLTTATDPGTRYKTHFALPTMLPNRAMLAMSPGNLFSIRSTVAFSK